MNMKRSLKWLIAIVATPVFLFLILIALLYCPPVQNWAIKRVTAYVSDKTGMEVSIERVNLSFPLDLQLDGLKMLRPNDSIPNKKDTVADVHRLVANVDLLPLLKSRVEVNELTFTKLKANTVNFIGDLRVRGDLQRLHIVSHAVNLVGDSIRVNKADIEGGWIDIALGDTVPDDPNKQKPLWRINIDKLNLTKTDFRLHMPGDTMSVRANFKKAMATGTELLLHDNIYKVANIDWQGGEFSYDQNYVRHASSGFDAAHIAMHDVNLGLDSFLYAAPKIRLRVRTANMKEKSGLIVKDFRGPFSMDSTSINLPDMYFQLPNTELSGRFMMDMNAFADKNPGQISTQLDGFLRLEDLRPFLTSVPKNIYQAIPNQRIIVKGQLEGNLRSAAFKQLRLAMPGYFDLTGTGWIADMMSGTDHLRSDLKLKGTANNLSFVSKLLPHDVRKTISFPQGVGINGDIHVRKTLYTGNIQLTQGGGRIRLNGAYNTATELYRLTADATAFPVQRFLPNMGLSAFSGSIKTQGRGTDFLSPKSSTNLSLSIRSFKYGNYVLDGLNSDISKQGEQLSAHVKSTNRMIGGDFTYKGRVNTKLVDGHLRGWLRRVDLHAMGVMDQRYVVSTWADVDVRSDMKDNHHVSGPLRSFRLLQEGRKKRQLLAAGNFDVRADVHSGSLETHVKGNLSEANLHAFGFIDKHYITSADADITLRSDMKKYYAVSGNVGNLLLSEQRKGERIPLAVGQFNLDATMRGEQIEGSINGVFPRIDLYQLGVVDKAMSTSFSTNTSFAMSGKDDMNVRGLIGDLRVTDKDRTYAPGDVNIDLMSRRDTVHAVLNGGDFRLSTAFNSSVNQLTESGTRIYKIVREQLTNRRIDQSAILRQLPTGHFTLRSGRDNLFSNLLAQDGYAFSQADINLTSSPTKGLDGQINIDSLVYNDIHLDSIRADLTSIDGQLNYTLSVRNNPKNAYPYHGYLQGALYEHGLQTHATILDNKGKKGFDLAMQAAMKGRGIQLSIISPQSILGYKSFTVNDSNYIYIGRDRRLSANLRLEAADGTGMLISTEDNDPTSLQNVTLSMNHFELGNLFEVLPFAPKLSGMLDGDYHLVQTEKELTISSDMTIKKLVYENSPMGDVGTQFVYMPKGDGTHYVDGIITQNGKEVGSLSGIYNNEGAGELDATLEMNRFPLNYVNGFVPDQIVGLDGVGEGTLTVKGPLKNLDFNGEIYLDSTYLVSAPYGIRMRFADDPVQIHNSHIQFENFELFASNGSPLDISGYLDFSNLNKMQLDAQLRAKDFQIINAKKNPRSEVYGKAFVDFTGRINGLLNNLQLVGNLDVLGSTDVTYVVRDGTLSTDDDLKDLVQFTNFNDSTVNVVKRPDITGFTMGLNVDIDEQAHVLCALNADQSNYVDFVGGGNLLLNYDPTNGVQVRGRYTLSDGKMKYSLPVIPLRTFNIKDGSYLEFTGDPMKPTLKITATEEVRTSVSNGSGEGRIVDFECGVSLTKQFPKPGVEFIITAPDDQEMQNILNTKSVEERSKLAVTMLASGMYFDGDNSASANTAMSGALASFLQTQVNSITGKALNSMGLDLTANMESAADVNGNLHTDYTFKFSKRLWNNRLRIIMGGRVSTGSQFSEDNGAYFDNFSLEYRLNQKETKYFKLYYEREAYDWLEGNLSEFGAGFMWRRKLRHFKDIFRSKEDNPVVAPQTEKPKRDTLINFVNDKKK